MRTCVRLGLLLVVVALLMGGDALGSSASGPADLFGDGSDGPITFSADAQFNPPVDAVVDSGPAAGTTLIVSSASGLFQAGQKILIHQTRGTGAGQWEMNEVQSYALGNIITVHPLAYTYTTSGPSAAQVLVMPEYTNVTVNASVTLSAKPWNGTTGGIFAVLVSGTAQIDGAVRAKGVGYRGGAAGISSNSYQGEGYPRIGYQGVTTANGNGGGGANQLTPLAGGGGGNGTPGSPSSEGGNPGSEGGLSAGTPDLTIAVFGGGGGGSSGSQYQCGGGRAGGSGGGIVFLFARNLDMGADGVLNATGDDGASDGEHGSGAGAGGSVLVRADLGAFGSGMIQAVGGAGGLDQGCTGTSSENGGSGGVGRIRVEYCTTVSGGIADPPASVAQISCDLQPPATRGPSVGGIAELPGAAQMHTTRSSPFQPPSTVVTAAVTIALLAFAAGALYVRRRWGRQL